MHNAHHEPPDTSLGFEQSDLSIKGITVGVGIYFLFTALVGAVVFFGMLIFGAEKPSGGEVGNRRIPPSPNPVLQNNITARTDIWNLRSREDFLLNNTSWVNQKQGVVRVPIDSAINMAASRGPAALRTAQTGPEEGGSISSAQQPAVPIEGFHKPPNTSAGSELTSGGNKLSGPGPQRVTVPEGGKLKQ